MDQHVESPRLFTIFELTSLTIRVKGADSLPEESSEVIVAAEEARLAACKSRREKGKLV
jgi:hypothetical protein